ncbi:unnamed protein product [Onchocerca ochengi]|uniref:LRRCT domain-containing protein n=1 Tax=Onchocerca ochengi TaxID=42157 RepID=A0A182DXD3_ONCOC|nr:unnamed protein product [Onchocerca ochengi]
MRRRHISKYFTDSIWNDGSENPVPLLYSLQQLTHLDLSHNKIRHLAGYDLLLPSLEVVDLSYNHLHVVKPTNFGDIIQIIELDGCPWRCDCHLRDFVAFQRKALNAKSSRCYEPARIRGINWDDLSLKVSEVFRLGTDIFYY